MSGDAVACGDGAGGAGCERQPFARQADRLQVRRSVVDRTYQCVRQYKHRLYCNTNIQATLISTARVAYVFVGFLCVLFFVAPVSV